ncbi:MAG: hypothetical protein ACJAUP_001390 [Cellvibrionaceae bacterium]|jgi:hypothetical protein
MSPAATYKVVFSGNTLGDRSTTDVLTRFSKAFNVKDKESLARLFSGKMVTLKRGLIYEQAQRYSVILQKLGADCCIESENQPLFAQSEVDYDYERKKRRRVAEFSSNDYANVSVAPKP